MKSAVIKKKNQKSIYTENVVSLRCTIGIDAIKILLQEDNSCTQHKQGKPQKKSSSLNGRAIKRGGWGVKGRAIKVKRTFFGTFSLSSRGEGVRP